MQRLSIVFPSSMFQTYLSLDDEEEIDPITTEGTIPQEEGKSFGV